MSRKAPSTPSLLGRGRATAQDVLAWVAALYTASALLLWMTSVITGDAGTIPLQTALTPPIVGLVVLLGGLALRLPSGAYSLKADRGRWRVPLYIAGALALPAIAAIQLRRRGQRTSPELWLTLPGWVCARMVVVSSLVIAASVWAWVQHWPLERVIDHTALSIALACTTILITGLGVRILARRELLLTPTALKVVAERRSLFRQPLVVLASASAALTVAPLLVAHLWLGDAAAMRDHAEATTLAEQLLQAAAPGHEDELGELLADNPNVGVRSSSGTLYGAADISADTALLGPRAPLYREQRRGITVVVPHSPDPLPPLLPFALLALLCLTTGTIATVEVLREVDGDTFAGKATFHQRSPGTDPPKTREWRSLRPMIEALLDRTADTSITRYIAEEAVDEADRRRLSLMATVGGDLRPILSTLVGQTAQLHGEPRSPEQIESLVAIEGGARSLARSLGELIEMAALADGSLRLSPEPLPVAALLAATISSVHDRTPELAVDVRCAPGLPPIYGDRLHLCVALERLLTFAGQQLKTRPLTLSADYEAAHPLGIRLTISTPKRPMSAVKAGIARRPFHRLAGQPGLGLDLARADAVIRLSSGSLDFQSYGEGMRFTVELPAAAPPPRPPRRKAPGSSTRSTTNERS